MSNYQQANTKRVQFYINKEDYFDLQVNQDNVGAYHLSGYPETDDSCLSCYIDVTNDECLSGDNLTSVSGYSWDDACNNGLVLENIGFTGVDNGLIRYQKDRIDNKEFYEIYTNSKYEIESGDTRLHLHAISGTTKLYDYPIDVNEDGSVRLSGGFWQGFFRSADNYSILPSTIDSTWNFEFLIRRDESISGNGRTLNDKYPENKGIFFYIGTRAENKWYEFYKNPAIPCIRDCDEDDVLDLFEDELDLSKEEFITKNGFELNSANDDYIISDNKFLLFDRTPSGITLDNYVGDETVMLAYKKNKSTKNLFLYLNRTPSGYTAENIDEVTSGETNEYNSFYKDLYENALAFFVDDEGCVGYKYLVKDCSEASEGTFSVLVGKSKAGVVKASQWAKINVKIKASEKNSMRLMFYADGKLKYITKELPKLRLRDLDELDEKEEGVAYNISLGGGTQGLAEMVLPDYMKNPENVYPLEKNFAGTFFGDFLSFKFYTC